MARENISMYLTEMVVSEEKGGADKGKVWYVSNLCAVLVDSSSQIKTSSRTNLTHVSKDLHLQEHHSLPNRTRL
jgi:hypothetical protein